MIVELGDGHIYYANMREGGDVMNERLWELVGDGWPGWGKGLVTIFSVLM